MFLCRREVEVNKLNKDKHGVLFIQVLSKKGQRLLAAGIMFGEKDSQKKGRS